MTQDEQLYLMLKGMISELPKEERRKCSETYDEIKAILLKHGQESLLPLGLLGFEVQQDNFFKEVKG